MQHVVSPLFFPGGDIGCLSVHGTINDVAVMGAKPLWLSAGFILEEGFPLATWRASSSRWQRPRRKPACRW
jgi:hydrogenase maturation factor